ncbi:formin-like protein 5 [Iris pallida]|uniref:Formin-like protein 5 n=1 Tax=Iris pallida TaxID=29817 RepID=A0AAX6GAR2_IRIPA|nr:formin-like protein 5 [Iris pallida]
MNWAKARLSGFDNILGINCIYFGLYNLANQSILGCYIFVYLYIFLGWYFNSYPIVSNTILIS